MDMDVNARCNASLCICFENVELKMFKDASFTLI